MASELRSGVTAEVVHPGDDGAQPRDHDAEVKEYERGRDLVRFFHHRYGSLRRLSHWVTFAVVGSACALAASSAAAWSAASTAAATWAPSVTVSGAKPSVTSATS